MVGPALLETLARGGGADGRTRPRHRRFTEITFDIDPRLPKTLPRETEDSRTSKATLEASNLVAELKPEIILRRLRACTVIS